MKLILGTMTFGGQVEKTGAHEIMDVFFSTGNNCLDTAFIYCDGDTELMLGELISRARWEQIHLATKAHPWGDDGLSASTVKHQLETSLRRLHAESVDLFYLHSPDLNTPIEDTLYACWQLHQAGKFKEFGLSNYAAWQVAEIYHLCERNDWMRPTVYQGMYNALTRDVERELFPCLRNYNIAFFAYNPLAGGLLSGKHQGYDHVAADGRFKLYESYRDRYWERSYFEAMSEIIAACEAHNVAPAAAALRWLQHHSCLTQNDGVILGASRLNQFKKNINALRQGPLPTGIVAAYDQGWDITRAACAKYFRP